MCRTTCGAPGRARRASSASRKGKKATRRSSPANTRRRSDFFQRGEKKMKRIALLLSALVCTTLVNAQNLSGPYVGGYLAGGSADAHWDISSGSKTDHSMSGGLVGGQGGYNWHRGSLLLGVHADLGGG